MNTINKGLHSINKSYLLLLQENSNRTSRCLIAILMVIILSIGCFMFVKASIEWAQYSKQELNKIKDNKLKIITDEINHKYRYVRTES